MGDGGSKIRRTIGTWLIPAVLLLAIVAVGLLTGPALGQAPDNLSPSSFLPLIRQESYKPWVSIGNRAASKAFYLTEYSASEGVPLGWTGDHGSCLPGTTTAEFKAAVFRRINYYRAMAGVPPILGFSEEFNQKAQAAALMFSVNKRLSHTPDSSWTCYSAAGREAAGSSNIQYGANGPSGIDNYMFDGGVHNYPVGHRRWILYPQTITMGTGDVPGGGGYYSANALWVFDRDNMWGPRPETREPFVAWPPPGFAPYFQAFPRWSFSYPAADFSQATVTMARDGQPISLAVQTVRDGYGENTIVWEPGVNTQAKPPADTTYAISITNVFIQGAPTTFSYEVILFDPET